MKLNLFLGQIPYFALYHWVQRLQFTNANGKKCGRTLCMWKESTLWPPDYECCTFTCWQPIKKCYLKIYVNPFGEIFLLNLWRRSRPWSWSQFVFFSRESVFTPRGYTFLMKPFGMEYNLETLQCTSSGQDKVLGRGAIELQFIHTQGTHTWRWPHRDLSGGQGTGEPSHNRSSLFDFPSYRHRPSLSPRRKVVFLYYRLIHIHLDFISTSMQF